MTVPISRRRCLVAIGGATVFGSISSGSQISGANAPASAETRSVRVALTNAPTGAGTVRCAGEILAKLPGSKTILDRWSASDPQPVRATSGGFRIGDRFLRTTRLELIGEGTDAEEPNFWWGSHRYRGTLRLYHQPNTRFWPVNIVPLRHYLASVIDGELPISFGEAARTAQAVVARSYLLAEMTRNRPFFDVYASTRSQHYPGWQFRTDAGRLLAGESESSRNITRATAGQILRYRGRVLRAYYSAVCGGGTLSAKQGFGDDRSPIIAVPCTDCREAPLYRWTRRTPQATVLAGINRIRKAEGKSPLKTPVTFIGRDGGDYRFRSGSGVVLELISGNLRTLFEPNLPSARFELRAEGTDWRADGRGHGHGVGLCQWGARGRGKRGWTADAILRHYYPEAELVTIAIP